MRVQGLRLSLVKVGRSDVLQERFVRAPFGLGKFRV